MNLGGVLFHSLNHIMSGTIIPERTQQEYANLQIVGFRTSTQPAGLNNRTFYVSMQPIALSGFAAHRHFLHARPGMKKSPDACDMIQKQKAVTQLPGILVGLGTGRQIVRVGA